MKLIFTWHEIGRYAKNAAKSFLKSIVGLLFSMLLTIVNLAYRAYKLLVSSIRKSPCAAVAITFAIMLAVSIISYAEMRVRLATAKWQRDSVEMKLDSIQILSPKTVNYYK